MSSALLNPLIIRILTTEGIAVHLTSGPVELAVEAGFISEPLPIARRKFYNFCATEEFCENYLHKIERVLKQVRSNDQIWKRATSTAGFYPLY